MAAEFHPSDYFGLLRRNRSVRLLWTAGAVSMIADWFHRVAIHSLIPAFLTWHVQQGHIAPQDFEANVLLWTTIALMCQLLPPFVCMPWIGVAVDRYSRRQVMLFADAVRAVLAVSYVVIARPEIMWLMFLAEVPLSLMAGSFDTAQKALFPDLVTEKRDLIVANALLHSSWGIMTAIGAITAGLAIHKFGVTFAFYLNAASFALSYLMVWRVRVHEKHLVQATKDTSDSGGFMEGVSYVAKRPGLLALVSAKPGWSLTGGMILALHTLMGTTVFENWGNPELGVGLLHGARGMGSVFGAFVAPIMYPWFRRAPLQAMAFIFLVYGVDYWIIAHVKHVLTAALLLTIGTTLSGMLWILPLIVLQQAMPHRLRGRVLAIDQGLTTLFMATSGLAAWALRDHGWPARDVAALAGTGLVVVGIIYLIAALVSKVDLHALFDEAAARQAREVNRES